MGLVGHKPNTFLFSRTSPVAGAGSFLGLDSMGLDSIAELLCLKKKKKNIAELLFLPWMLCSNPTTSEIGDTSPAGRDPPSLVAAVLVPPSKTIIHPRSAAVGLPRSTLDGLVCLSWMAPETRAGDRIGGGGEGGPLFGDGALRRSEAEESKWGGGAGRLPLR